MTHYASAAPIPSLGRYGRSILLSLCAILALLLVVQPVEASAQTYRVADVPKVFAQDSTQLLSDPARLLPVAEQRAVNEALTKLRLATGVEVAAVILPSIGDEAIEPFATELFRTWGLGSSKLNDGLLLLLVLDQRKVRFEVGYGLESVLTDARSSEIQRELMRPHLREGQYGLALLAAIDGVRTSIEAASYSSDRRGRSAAPDLEISWPLLLAIYLGFMALWGLLLANNLQGVYEQAQRQERRLLLSYPGMRTTYRTWAILLCLLCLPIGLLFLYYMQRKLRDIEQRLVRCPNCAVGILQHQDDRTTWGLLDATARLEEQLHSRHYSSFACSSCTHLELLAEDLPGRWKPCPHCGARTAEPSGQRYVRIQGKRYIQTSYRCRHCGGSHEEHQRDTSSEADAALGAMVLGGLLSGGRHRGGGGFGGGFSGGSFGGGSSGGGGATSSW